MLFGKILYRPVRLINVIVMHLGLSQMMQN
jgi:hypothetical protein